MRKNQLCVFKIFILLALIYIYCFSGLICASYFPEQDNNYIEQVKEACLNNPVINKYIESHNKYEFRFEYNPNEITNIQMYQIDKKNNRALCLDITYNALENTAHFEIPDNTTLSDCLKAYEIAIKYIKQGNGFYVYYVTYGAWDKKLRHVVHFNIFSDSDFDKIIDGSNFYIINVINGKIYEEHGEP